MEFLPATFFVQTHVGNRGGDPGGIAAMEEALSGGRHDVMIHNGWDVDHGTLPLEDQEHTYRIGLPAYEGGANALESDLIRAKARIASLQGQGGANPEYVRAPFGKRDPATLLTYADYGLAHKHWHVDSGDTATTNPAVISAVLEAQILAQLAVGNRDIVVLFHDVHGHTASNIGTFVAEIQALVVAQGFIPVFRKKPLPNLP